MSESRSFDEQKKSIDQVLSHNILMQPLSSRIRAVQEASPLSMAVVDLAQRLGPSPFEVIIELNAYYPDGLAAARSNIVGYVRTAAGQRSDDALRRDSEVQSSLYVFVSLTAAEIAQVVELDGEAASTYDSRHPLESTNPGTPHREVRALLRIWESTPIGPLTVKSIRTVKADAAQTAFSANGDDIVWAVMDSGIDQSHPHFQTHHNLATPPPLAARSFVGGDPLRDVFGHGTHVAGIIAGEAAAGSSPYVAAQSIGADGATQYHLRNVDGIRGMAPRCKLLSLKVLNDDGGGDATALLQAIQYVQDLNDNGRRIQVHGVNISVGYPFDVQWFACGRTPVCVEVNRLVRSGVVVVVAAGNTGHVTTAVNTQGAVTGTRDAGQAMSINDPGNADLAITVGSTDREMPHLYGISYYSSKGPTGDGRLKPDVVAPGEHIISAAAGANRSKVPTSDAPANAFDYVEDTGTSMAAPHVSGVLAGFLSVRREFIGQATDVRDLVIASATDLKRDSNLQGAGLIDLMRLIQTV